VWRLLSDSASWPEWTSSDSHQAVRAGGPDGTGEIRAFRVGRHTITEETVEEIPGRRLA
jgi:uncharacterized protein YjdB